MPIISGTQEAENRRLQFEDSTDKDVREIPIETNKLEMVGYTYNSIF
jgi:hypothetical protein